MLLGGPFPCCCLRPPLQGKVQVAKCRSNSSETYAAARLQTSARHQEVQPDTAADTRVSQPVLDILNGHHSSASDRGHTG